MGRPWLERPRMELMINSIGRSARPPYACRIMFVSASSTARVTALHSSGENPNDSVNRSIRQLQPQQQTAVRVAVALLAAASPLWGGGIHDTLCFALGADVLPGLIPAGKLIRELPKHPMQ